MQSQTPGYVLTELITPPASAALTTLANVKDELGLATNDSSNDSRLTRYIAEESAHIARYCNRIFGLALWTDQFRPQKGVWGEGVRAAVNPLTLSHWPLIGADVCAFTGNTYSNQTVDTISSVAGLSQGQPVFGAGITPGTTIAAVIAPSGIVLSQPATATAQGVSLSTGIGILETVGGTATWLVPWTDFELETNSLLPGDEGHGWVFRLNVQGNPRIWPSGLINVWYQAGYNLPDDDEQDSPLPQDLTSACELAVVRRYQARGRDPLLVERTQPGGIGTERYWVGGAPGQRGSLAPEIAAMVDHYRVPVVG